MNFIKPLLPLILILSLLSCTRNNFSAEQNNAATGDQDSNLPIQLKKPFPEVPLKTYEGKSVSMDDYKGKVVIVNFWATWCEPCLRELPELQKIYESHKDQGLEILAVNLDTDPVKRVPSFREKLNLSFPILIDPENDLLGLLYIQAIPFNVVIDKHQRVRKIHPGYEDWSSSENKKFIESLIREA